MTEYETDCPLNATPDDALARAEATLSAVGFRIVDRPRSGLVAEGPGLNSTRQNPLLGATRVELTAGDRTLRAVAEMGGVDRMRKFLLWFPLLLGLGLGLLGLLVQLMLGVGVPNAAWMLAALGPMAVLPWAFIGPWMAGRIVRQTERAVDTLVHNAAG